MSEYSEESEETEVCLLRATDFVGKLHQRHYDHNVLITSHHKDDTFKDVLDLQPFICGHFSLVFNTSNIEDSESKEHVWNMGHSQCAFATIYSKYYNNVKEVFQALALRTLKPTYVLTDDTYMGDVVSQYVPFYCMYPSMKLCQPKLGRNIEALCLEKPIDIRNPLHRLHLSGFFKTRAVQSISVKKFLGSIPDNYILFFALGTYRKDYNYQHVIGGLYTLLKHAKGHMLHRVFVALGGNFNDFNIKDEEYYHILLSSVRADLERFNIIFLDRISTTDKKALLRRSSAMIYLNTNPGYNPDLRLSLSVGCPIITVKAGYAEHVIIHGYSGFHMEKIDPIKVAVYMYRLTHPLKREYHCECARKHYLREHTLTLYTLDSFREEDTPRPPPIVANKKESKDTKGRNKSTKKKQVVEEPPEPKPKEVVVLVQEKRFLLYKSLSTNTLHPVSNKSLDKKTESVPNIKIATEKEAAADKEPEVKGKGKKKLKSPRNKTTASKLLKPSKPREIEEMDITPRTRLIMKAKSTSKLTGVCRTQPKPPPRPLAKVYQRKQSPPSLIRVVGAFAIKKDPPADDA